MILGEIGDIHRFSQPHKLLAFAGLDPSVNNPATFVPAIRRCPNVEIPSLYPHVCRT